MSLLARRRSSQAVEEAYSQNQTTPGLRLPDDYDPRIRGKVVHDFSAPRASRTASSNEVNVPQTQAKERRGSSVLSQKKVSPRPGSSSTLEDDSPSSQEREHTPVFKENFDDDVEPWTSDMDSEANRRTSAFMYQVSLQASQPSPDPSSLPAFARNLPPHVSSKNADSSHNASSPPSKAPLKVVLVMPLSNLDSGRCSPPTSPPKARSRATSVTDSSLQALGSPQRYKSNASRFSFDLAGLGSAAQEKLLEEKHRQKAKRRERESVTSDNNGLDDGKYDDEYADYDDMDDDDSLEERIPGVNANAEDLDMPVLQQATEVTFISPNKSSFESAASAVSTGLTSPGTPKDIQSQLAGFAVSKSSPNLTKLQLEKSQSSMKGNDSRPSSLPGGAVASKFDSHTFDRVGTSGVSSAGRTNRFDHQDEDDMYFDDGMIEDLDDQEGQALDESVFDDDMSRTYGLPLRDMKPFATPDDQKTLFNYQFQMGQLRSQNTVMHDRIDVAPSPSKSPEDDAAIAELRDSVTDLKQPARASFSYTAGLTRDNLGLHDQLAMAANQAALDGKFNRSYSQGSTQESNDGLDSSVWINPLNSQDQQHMIDFPQSEKRGEIEDFAFDDAQMAFTDAEEDDPIIAAANAEALENDDDGFYGQEFGFFARASGSSESEYVNGGYFGPRTLEGVHRMNSGRDKFQEPSLTPITERSEWSNRNSTISLAMHGYPLTAQYPSNPQLASLVHFPEDKMSLEALQRLRRGAWNGSNGSLQSNSNSQNSSPLNYLAPGMMVPSLLQPTNGNSNINSPNSQNLGGSFHSFTSSNGHASSNDSDPSSSLDSPTITLSTTQPGLMMQPMGPPPPPPTETSPVRRNALMGKNAWAPRHRRNSSGAESVSYREEGGKWVCEKRRVDAAGEVEVLRRNFVERGRI